MTPTLVGRLQTRIFLAATVGVLWTAAITPALAHLARVDLVRAYHMTFQVLGLMTLLGLGWEVVYHVIQQARWDKDWPSVFALLAVVPEAIPLWYVAHILHVIPWSTRLSSPFISLYAIHIGTTWLLTWLFMQGPLRVMHLRWRFEGGRVLAFAPGRLRHRHAWPNAVPAGTAVAAGMADAAGAATAGGDAVEAAGALGAAAKPAAVAAAAGPAVTAAAGPAVATGPGTMGPGTMGPGTLTQGLLCVNGHFSHPEAKYCVVCGTAVLLRTELATYGRRPPAGILILADGSTAVLDHDLTLTTSEPDGELAFLPAGEHPRTVAQIKLVGWQPVVSSPVRAIWLFLPGGSNVRMEPNVPVPLVPGAELTLGRYRIRYESPHGWPTGSEPSPIGFPSLAGRGEPQPRMNGRRRRRQEAQPAPAAQAATPQATPAAQTVATPEAARDTQTVATPQATPATQADATPQATPAAQTVATPEATPATQADATPQATPAAQTVATPEAAPAVATPQAAPAAQTSPPAEATAAPQSAPAAQSAAASSPASRWVTRPEPKG